MDRSLHFAFRPAWPQTGMVYNLAAKLAARSLVFVFLFFVSSQESRMDTGSNLQARSVS